MTVGESKTRHLLDICDTAMSLPDAERPAYLDDACGGDVGLRRSVEAVMGAIASADGFLAGEGDEPAPMAVNVGDVIDSYHIVETLGEGGMGSVFLAERKHDGFTQRVALKVVRGRFLANELIERFDKERKILAALGHPYIAALLDGGTTENGLPYLVMEYVEGLPIDEYCDEQRLDVSARIRLVQKVALAVQAAHQNLIVHRDLKPSNVLITPDGIPKLLDFGIAKLLDVDGDGNADDETVFGGRAMTPDFASPEQILENRVTTASDVYSLGVLTYQLVTGVRPYHIDTKSHGEMIRTVEALAVPRPSTRLDVSKTGSPDESVAELRSTTWGRLRRTLQGDLDTVLLKALQRDPGRRYASIAGFSADLGRFLDGQPVVARPDSTMYRLSRFVGRHRFGVALSSLFVLTLAIALVLTSRAYVSAEAARAEADQRFNDVRALAKTMMFDVYDEVSAIGGATRARETLASSAQSYLDSLAAGDNAPPDVRLEAGTGYERLGDVLGGVDDMTLGDRNTAEENYKLAERYLGDLHREFPDNREYALAYASMLHKLAGHALYSENEIELARDYATRSVATYESLDNLADEAVLGQVGALRELADTYDWAGDFAEAKRILEHGLEVLEPVDTDPETNPAGAGVRARVLTDIGDALYYLDDMQGAVVKLREARDVHQAALPFASSKPRAQRSLAITLFTLAGTEMDAGYGEEALVTIDDGLEISKTLLDADSEDTGALRLYIAIAQQRGTILSQLGLHELAIEQALESYELQKQVNEYTSDDAIAYRDLTIEIYNVGQVYLNAERREEACGWLADAADRLVELREEGNLSGNDEGTLLPEIEGHRDTACK